MGESSIGSCVAFTPFCFVLFISCFMCLSAAAESSTNKYFTISELCNETYKKGYTRMIEGSVITSVGEKSIDCVITFQTDTILQNFMLRFERLQLDCNDHLYVYDGAHTTSTYKVDLSCRDTLQNVGTIYTHSNYVTFNYSTDRWGPESNGFKLIITAFKAEKNPCPHFRCKKTNFCIHRDLTCDKVNHCGDHSDESTSLARCPSPPLEDILGYPGILLVLVIISAVVIFCICGVTVVICVYRRNRTKQLQRAQQHNAYHSDYGMDIGANYGTNGIGSSYPVSVPLQHQQTVVIPQGSSPGNPDRPAYGVGCNTQPRPTPLTDHSLRRVG